MVTVGGPKGTRTVCQVAIRHFVTQPMILRYCQIGMHYDAIQQLRRIMQTQNDRVAGYQYRLANKENRGVGMEDKTCSIEQCDIFDFMANHVGLTIIHPGGFDTTRKLLESCHIDWGALRREVSEPLPSYLQDLSNDSQYLRNPKIP